MENDERQAARHYRYVGENVLAEQHERAANAIAAERAARERAEAEKERLRQDGPVIKTMIEQMRPDLATPAPAHPLQ